MRRVLVIRFSQLGDTAMVLPTLYGAALAEGDVQFTLLTRARFTGLMVDAPANVSAIGVDLTQYRGLMGLVRLFARLRKEGFTDVVDQHDVLRSKVLRTLFRLTGARVRVINKGRRAKRRLCRLDRTFRHRYPVQPLQPMTERYRDTFRRAGLRVLDWQPRTTAERQGIGIAPFAQHRGKIYPLEQMERVVAALSRRGDPVYLFGGGKQETEVLEAWAARYPGVTCLAGRLGMAEELEQMRHLRLMVSMDSANQHMASLVGTRVVSIWGATHPYCGFLGFGQQENDCVQLDLPCRPCSVFGNRPCPRGDYACLSTLHEERILDKI